jgi:diguanylate cyclase (GGDEF)-like protein
MIVACYDRSLLRQQQAHARIVDPETGCYAFDFFCDRLREEMARDERYGHGVALLLLEVDHLKRYEQVHGLREALVALSQIVHVLAARLRPVDTLARYQQWQLTACLPETDAAGGEAVARRLCEAVASATMPHVEPALTLSVGVTAHQAGDTVAALIERARRALYRAQMDGGNSVVRASEA